MWTDGHGSTHAGAKDLDADRPPGPNIHWPRDVHAKRNHLSGREVATACPAGQMLFRPEPKKKKVMADLYRVTSPDDPVLENGNKLCRGKPVAYLIVWKSEKVANETDLRTLAPFSGPKFSAGSPDDCGRYIYDAGSH
jgi:hypothetical protein